MPPRRVPAATGALLALSPAPARGAAAGAAPPPGGGGPPLVTFIVPTAGRGALAAALESLQAQRPAAWRAVVVVDAAAPPGARAAVDAPAPPAYLRMPGHVAADRRVTWVLSPPRRDRGAGRTADLRDAGISRVQTEWIAFVDDDDTLDAGYVAALARGRRCADLAPRCHALRQFPGALAAASDARRPRGLQEDLVEEPPADVIDEGTPPPVSPLPGGDGDGGTDTDIDTDGSPLEPEAPQKAPEPEAPQKAEPETPQEPAESVKQNVTFEGDVKTTLGLTLVDGVVGGEKLSKFLKECSDALAPVACIQMFQGSIIVTLQADSQEEMDAAVATLTENGLDLPSFDPLALELTLALAPGGGFIGAADPAPAAPVDGGGSDGGGLRKWAIAIICVVGALVLGSGSYFVYRRRRTSEAAKWEFADQVQMLEDWEKQPRTAN